MERTTKKALGEMIGEMLQVDDINANQMQIIDMLCKINESDEIAANTVYYNHGEKIDDFKDFVVENTDEIWNAFHACEIGIGDYNIRKLVLINSKERAGENEDTRIIVNFKYFNGIPKFCYVRIVYNIKNKEGDIVKSIFNWNDEASACTFRFDEIESHDKKSDFFTKIMFD